MATQQVSKTLAPADSSPEVPHEGNDADEGDSAFGDTGSIVGSTTSLTESIMDYRKIHGRTFQNSKTTDYWGPNDDQQNDGLDITHHWVTILLEDKLFLAPIGDRPQAVLDVGTGTGIWAIDVGDRYPSAEVIGTDLSPIQPSWVPPNVKFHIDDAQLEWTFKHNSFDLVHIRSMFGSISDWHALYSEAFKATRPGGWIEDFEFDITDRSDNPRYTDDPNHVFKQWAALFFEAGERLGKTFKMPQEGRMKRYMEEAGFVDVTVREWRIPIGGWPADPKMKQIGLYCALFIEQSLEGFALFLLSQVMGWEYTEIQALCGKMRKALNDMSLKPYFNAICVYGRKPDSTNH